MQINNFIDEKQPIGMNNQLPSHLLPSGIYQQLNNVVVDQQRIAKRKGTTQTAAALGGLSQSILGLANFNPVSGTNYLVALVNGASNAQLYKWSGSGSWSTLGTASFTPSLDMNFVQASNILYGFNGTECVSVDSTLTFTLNPASVPIGKFGVWFHNYLFVAGVAGTPNRLYWSAVGDPTNWATPNTSATGSGYLDVNANDGDQITAMYIFNDELYVFKNNTIWSITGFSGSTFTTTTNVGQNLNAKIYGYGTPSHRSVISTGRDLYYISFAGGIPHFRSLVQTQYATTLEQGIVSFDIEVTMQGLNLSKLAKVAAIFDGKYIRWGAPNGASTYNNIVLVMEPALTAKGKVRTHHSWVTWTGFNPACWVLSALAIQPTIYFGDGAATGLVYQADTAAYTDNGTPVAMTAQTRNMRLDTAHKSKFVYLYLNYKTGSSGSLVIGANVDNSSTYTTQQTLSLVGTSPGLGPTGTFTLGVSVLGGATIAMNRTVLQHLTGHLLGIQYTESTANYCEIYDYRVYAIPKGLRAS